MRCLLLIAPRTLRGQETLGEKVPTHFSPSWPPAMGFIVDAPTPGLLILARALAPRDLASTLGIPRAVQPSQTPYGDPESRQPRLQAHPTAAGKPARG